MKNRLIDNMIRIWDGHYMPLNFIRGVECYLYLVEGPRAIIVSFDFDEDWSATLDVVVSQETMEIILKMENLFEVPCIIGANYRDRQCWIKVMDVYMMMTKQSGRNAEDITHEGGVFIPKESFQLLIKAGKKDVD